MIANTLKLLMEQHAAALDKAIEAKCDTAIQPTANERAAFRSDAIVEFTVFRQLLLDAIDEMNGPTAARAAVKRFDYTPDVVI